jgi:hypothetical protein
MTTLLVSTSAVREYLALNATGSTSQYSEATMSSNILAAQSMLEKATGRWLVDRGTTTFIATSMNRPSLIIPGFRSVTGVTQSGTALTIANPATTNDGTVWLQGDSMGSGVYTGLQFRPYNTDRAGPWWLSNPQWFDRNLDSPWYPGNYGGNGWYTSAPTDVVVTGLGGYSLDDVPYAVLHAVKVLAGFYTMRPASLLADVAITPAGGVVNYSQLPSEVQTFISQWSLGEQWATVG